MDLQVSRETYTDAADSRGMQYDILVLLCKEISKISEKVASIEKKKPTKKDGALSRFVDKAFEKPLIAVMLIFSPGISVALACGTIALSDLRILDKISRVL